MLDFQSDLKRCEMPATKFLRFWHELYDARFILRELVRQQLILRYRRTVFGYFWTLFNPLLMMSVTAVVFSTIFKMDLKTYAIFLFAGMIPFTYFSSTVTQSGQALIGNEGLIKKIYIPRLLFPLSIAIALLIDSTLTAIALLIIIFVIGGTPTTALLFIPLAYLLLFFFTFGVAQIMTICTVYFRDLQHVVGVLMQALLFLTPVFYKPEALTGKVTWIIALNPLTQFVELFRRPIYGGELPPVETISAAVILSAASVAIGLWFFHKHENTVIFRL
ncbi:ABC transporter permease [Pelomicrobium sp. G1]|uniref:ABC transporter permease n=1 Tax=unclassified Pelomicrobium TaxID=2815318 RepID=UPI003F764705